MRKTIDDKLCLAFSKMEDSDQVLVCGAKEKGDVDNGDALQQAFELGQRI